MYVASSAASSGVFGDAAEESHCEGEFLGVVAVDCGCDAVFDFFVDVWVFGEFLDLLFVFVGDFDVFEGFFFSDDVVSDDAGLEDWGVFFLFWFDDAGDGDSFSGVDGSGCVAFVVEGDFLWGFSAC